MGQLFDKSAFSYFLLFLKSNRFNFNCLDGYIYDSLESGVNIAIYSYAGGQGDREDYNGNYNVTHIVDFAGILAFSLKINLHNHYFNIFESKYLDLYCSDSPEGRESFLNYGFSKAENSHNVSDFSINSRGDEFIASLYESEIASASYEAYYGAMLSGCLLMSLSYFILTNEAALDILGVINSL